MRRSSAYILALLFLSKACVLVGLGLHLVQARLQLLGGDAVAVGLQRQLLLVLLQLCFQPGAAVTGLPQLAFQSAVRQHDAVPRDSRGGWCRARREAGVHTGFPQAVLQLFELRPGDWGEKEDEVVGRRGKEDEEGSLHRLDGVLLVAYVCQFSKGRMIRFLQDFLQDRARLHNSGEAMKKQRTLTWSWRPATACTAWWWWSASHTAGAQREQKEKGEDLYRMWSWLWQRTTAKEPTHLCSLRGKRKGRKGRGQMRKIAHAAIGEFSFSLKSLR